jgi:hypothetical protein
MWRPGSGAQSAPMTYHHEMMRALVQTHQRELEREAATRRLARILRRRRRTN